MAKSGRATGTARDAPAQEGGILPMLCLQYPLLLSSGLAAVLLYYHTAVAAGIVGRTLFHHKKDRALPFSARSGATPARQHGHRTSKPLRHTELHVAEIGCYCF